MQTSLPAEFEDLRVPMQTIHQRLLEALAVHHLVVEDYPDWQGQGQSAGIAAARAYPIQGVLKYHGMADWQWRTAYLPSISVNNDAAYSLTLVEFDPARQDDQVTINGQRAGGRDLARVQQSLDVIRRYAGITSGARVWSRNVTRTTTTGKGLGTSASASAALAAAALAATLGSRAVENRRFLSTMARLLAGSGCRSAVGGIGLWLSYPGIAHEDSFAIRLDNRDQLADMRLITVPIDSRIGLKTEQAHEDAPHSAFFRTWMLNRQTEALECIEAVQRGDWRVVGQLAELDSIQLHGVTMSGSRENKIFAWEPENIHLFRLCNDLRAEGVPVYFSTDTGPTTVCLTHKDHVETVLARIRALGLGLEALAGQLGGPAVLVDPDEARQMLAAE